MTRRRQSSRGRVRIIAGEWRGRYLDVCDMDGLRPTPDRVRETVFNWLVPFLPGATVLDLFAGSGAFGFEALSRDAQRVVFVDSERRVTRALQAAVEKFDADVRARVVLDNAENYLRSTDEIFDIVFLDPPYAAKLLDASLAALLASNCLARAARVYLEYPADQPEPLLPAGLEVLKQKTAGNVCYLLAQYDGGQCEQNEEGA